MRPPIVFANAADTERVKLRSLLRGPGRCAVRAVMVLLSLQGLSPAQISVLLEYDAATVRRWIGRFNTTTRPVVVRATAPRSSRTRPLWPAWAAERSGSTGCTVVGGAWTARRCCSRQPAGRVGPDVAQFAS